MAYISTLLQRAGAFEKQRAAQWTAGRRGHFHETQLEILTPEELCQRLKVSRTWIKEKRRPRCPHPLPALTNRPLRFNWFAIVTWLHEEEQIDAERLKSKRR